MDAGSFQIPLVESTPQFLVDQLSLFGWVAVTPTYRRTFTASDVWDTAMWSGVKMAHSGRRRQNLEGYGAAIVLGQQSGLFSYGRQMSDLGVTDTADDFIDGYVLNSTDHSATPINELNGLTPGTITAGSSKTLYGDNGWYPPREWLDRICDAYDYEWRVNPDRTLDAGTQSTLFGTTPTVLLNPYYGGREGEYTAFTTDLDVTEDVETYANGYVVTYSSGGASAAQGVYAATDDLYTPTGEPYHSHVDKGNYPHSSGAWNFATVIPNQYQVIRREVRVRVLDATCVRRDVGPGDTVAVWDPEQGLHDQTSTDRPFRGHRIFPIEARLQGITWPVTQGMGVWAITTTGDKHTGGGTATVTLHDLTPYIEWETGPTTLEIGAVPRQLGQTAFAYQNR